MNGDGILNILDVISLVQLILENEPIDNILADINGDGVVNVLDVIVLVNIILG